MLKVQIAIVTGASRGIGREIAEKLADQGMKKRLSAVFTGVGNCG